MVSVAVEQSNLESSSARRAASRRAKIFRDRISEVALSSSSSRRGGNLRHRNDYNDDDDVECDHANNDSTVLTPSRVFESCERPSKPREPVERKRKGGGGGMDDVGDRPEGAQGFLRIDMPEHNRPVSQKHIFSRTNLPRDRFRVPFVCRRGKKYTMTAA